MHQIRRLNMYIGVMGDH